MIEALLIPAILVIALCLVLSNKACMILAHILNNIFNLPHPGPHDFQGACWCRRHEGPNDHSFGDYLKQVVGGRR